MIDLNISALVALTHRYLPKMRQKKMRRDYQYFFDRKLSGDSVHGDLRRDQSLRDVIQRSDRRRKPLAQHNRHGGLPGTDRNEFFAAAKAVPFSAKGMQTPEAVVEKALKAVKGKKPLVISGIANYIGAVLGTIAPDSLVTRVVGNVLRPKVKEKKN